MTRPAPYRAAMRVMHSVLLTAVSALALACSKPPAPVPAAPASPTASELTLTYFTMPG